MTCEFCCIVTGAAPATVIREWPDALAIRPRSGGVNSGHVLVLPRVHVDDVSTDPVVTAAVMQRAAELAGGHLHVNVIASRGSAATQTIHHLHVHVVPREVGDGLSLPWTPQHEERAGVEVDDVEVDDPAGTGADPITAVAA